MAKQTFTFDDFIKDVSPDIVEFITGLHDYLLLSGCVIKIEQAKSGYVVSYSFNKRVLLNFVFRKNGLIARIYGDFAHTYTDFLETLPAAMLKAIDKAGVCKRLIDPEKCNSKCAMGYDFTLNGTHYQKCRYGAFMFSVNDESNPFIKNFIENEVNGRSAVK